MDVLGARDIHSEGMIAVTREKFHTLTIMLAKKMSSSNKILHTIWSVLERIISLGFMSDFPSLSAEVVPVGGRQNKDSVS